MYKSILVPLDGSRRAESILPHVEALAHSFEAKIHFLTILEPVFALVAPYDAVPIYNEQDERQRYAESKAYLDGWAGEMREKGLSADSRLVYGTDIVRQILNAAKSEAADLIAMASHGRSGLGRVFYGSVAAGVLHGADRPLLLVRAGEF